MGEANKNVKPENLVEEGAAIEWSGINGTVQGTAKNNPPEMKELYGSGEQTGHFFPVKFKPAYYGRDIELSGRTGGSRTIRPTAGDPYLIIRLENLDDGNKLTAKVKTTQEVIFVLDFAGVTKEGDV